ncbi:MAG: hypothetical protein EGQ74_10710 [Bacteroides nordii]|nr:hypothetical protein [Bacteroides nordii]
MKLFCKTLICKGVVKHKNERKKKEGKKEAHYNIYARTYTRGNKLANTYSRMANPNENRHHPFNNNAYSFCIIL